MNLASTACFLCELQIGKIHLPGGVIYEDDLVYIGHVKPDNQATTYLGCLIAQLKRHIPGLAKQTDEEAQALGLVVARLARALKVCKIVESIYTFVIGHLTPYLHILVVPRYPGTPKKYWGTRIDLWPDAPRGGSSDIENLCERLPLNSRYEHRESSKKVGVDRLRFASWMSFSFTRKRKCFLF